jgi:hypothetical protein
LTKNKTKGFIKTRVKDSIKPSALVFKGGSIGFEFARVGKREGKTKGFIKTKFLKGAV